jgi:hypothetical protein
MSYIIYMCVPFKMTINLLSILIYLFNKHDMHYQRPFIMNHGMLTSSILFLLISFIFLYKQNCTLQESNPFQEMGGYLERTEKCQTGKSDSYIVPKYSSKNENIYMLFQE